MLVVVDEDLLELSFLSLLAVCGPETVELWMLFFVCESFFEPEIGADDALELFL